jgi:hypothetical protein
MAWSTLPRHRRARNDRQSDGCCGSRSGRGRAILSRHIFSPLKAPDKSKFPGTGPNGNGIPIQFKTQDQWLDVIKTNGCGNCHQLGNFATRTIPSALRHFDSSTPPGRAVYNRDPAAHHCEGHGSAVDPGGRSSGLHDLTATDKRNPEVNANGPVYGATELSTDTMPVLDPIHNTKSVIEMPVRDPEGTPSSALTNPVFTASPYFGQEQVWDSQVNAHSPVMDQEGRIYFTAQSRSAKNPPSYCGKDSAVRSAQLYPLTDKPDGFVQNSRQVTIYDPRTNRFSFIDTCFGT